MKTFFEKIKPGDPIVTIGGIHAMILDIQQERLVVSLAVHSKQSGTTGTGVMTIQKGAVDVRNTLQVYPPVPKKKAAPAEKKKKKA